MKHILLAALPLILLSCFRDKGNYDYRDVNEVIISAPEFEKDVVSVRINLDRITISPQITFTLDPEMKNGYEYEWVAVGQNFQRNERFILGTQRDLDYQVKLAPDNYMLYLKVTDLSTGLVFSRGVAVEAGTLFSKGLVLGGQTIDGKGQVDILSMSHDTMLVKNALTPDGIDLSPVQLVWIENIEYPTDDRLYVGTTGKTYLFRREDFTANSYSDLYNAYTVKNWYTNGFMSDNQKVNDKRQVLILDGYPYIVYSDSESGAILGNPFSHYGDYAYFTVAGKMACNHNYTPDVRTMSFYNEVANEFGFISGLTAMQMKKVPNGENDPYDSDTKVDFGPDGLDFVTTVNSLFGIGQSATVLKHPTTGKHYIYTYLCSNDGSIHKDKRYEVDEIVATGFAFSKNHMMTTRQGYMLYTVRNKLYGYNFRAATQKCTELWDFGVDITAVFNDYVTAEKYKDHFYLATFKNGVENSGELYKFETGDTADAIEITQLNKWDGLLQINSIFYKAY